jgi:hypothetical protein
LALCSFRATCAAEDPDSAVIQANREAGLAASALSKSYKEFFPTGALGADKENGWTGGVAGHVSWMGDLGGVSMAYASAEASVDSGHLDFHGTLFNSNTPLNFRSGLTQAAGRIELGKGFAVARGLVLTPVLQGGYQWWDRNLRVNQREVYRMFLAGAAVHADYAATSRLVLRGRLGAAEMVSPHIDFDFATHHGADLRARAVYQGSLGVDYAVSRLFHLFAEAEVQHYRFGRSDVVQTIELGPILEPNSRTNDLQLQLGAAYAF